MHIPAPLRRGLAGLAGAALMVTAIVSTTAPAAAADRSLTIAAASDPQLSQIMAFRAGNSPWSTSVFETLITLDPKNREPKPLLAAKWKFAPDNLSLKLALRSDVKYHDGRQFTADDVKYSLEQAALPANGSQLGFIARSFKGIVVNGPTSVTLQFNEPTSNVMELLSFIPMVDSKTFADIKAGKTVVGTGPFQWVSWTPGAQVQLTKFAGHRNAAKIALDSITVRIINNASAQLNALRSAAVDIAMGLSVTDALTLDIMPGFSVIRAGGVIYPMGMNVTMAPFTDVRVRQAVGYAIDRKRLNQQVFGGTGRTTSLFWGTTEPGWSKADSNAYTYNPTKAKALIDAAGAAGAEFTIIVPNIPIMKQIYEVLANNLQAVGLKPTAAVTDVTVYDAKQAKGDLGASWLPLHGQVGFGASTLISSLPSLRQGNPSGYWSAEYDGLRKKLLAANTLAQKTAAIKALSKFMLTESWSQVMLQAPSLIAYSDKAKGITFSGLGLPNLSTVKLS